ncbi:MAG: cytochrome b [Alcaligenaceae bacterium]
MAPYHPARRLLHWLVALCLALLFVLGLWMTARASANLWDDQTNLLYGLHKALGVTVLLLMMLRFILKLYLAAPAYPPSLTPRNILAAKAVHGLLYALLFAVPLFGWAGVTAYPALITVAGYHLPPMPWVAQNEALAKQLFAVHGTLAFVLAALVIGHFAAALLHLFYRRDGVFERIWPGKHSKPR